MRNAFTLIEILVVVAISALLSTITISYLKSGQNTVSLSIEEAKISQLILEAKELSLSTYGAAGDCGYGVVINADNNPQTYSLFAYTPYGVPPTQECPDVENITNINTAQESTYQQGSWQVPVSTGITIATSGNSLATILFYPPDPAVFLSHDGQLLSTSTPQLFIHLVTNDSAANIATITVNSEGQVSF